MFDAVFRDRALYLPRGDALVLADLHVGREDDSDVEFPLGEAADLDERLTALLAAFEPATVVFAGDVLHQFSHVSERAAESFRTLGDRCREHGARPVAVAGNHDAMLDTVWDGDVHDAYEIELESADDTGNPSSRDDSALPELTGPVVVRHGHAEPPASEATETGLYLIGHDHPTIEIEGKRRPCYLYVPGDSGTAPALMLPAFNRLPAGVTVNGMSASDFQSPFVSDADAVRPIVWDPDADEQLVFPPLGEFRRLL